MKYYVLSSLILVLVCATFSNAADLHFGDKNFAFKNKNEAEKQVSTLIFEGQFDKQTFINLLNAAFKSKSIFEKEVSRKKLEEYFKNIEILSSRERAGTLANELLAERESAFTGSTSRYIRLVLDFLIAKLDSTMKRTDLALEALQIQLPEEREDSDSGDVTKSVENITQQKNQEISESQKQELDRQTLELIKQLKERMDALGAQDYDQYTVEALLNLKKKNELLGMSQETIIPSMQQFEKTYARFEKFTQIFDKNIHDILEPFKEPIANLQKVMKSFPAVVAQVQKDASYPKAQVEKFRNNIVSLFDEYDAILDDLSTDKKKSEAMLQQMGLVDEHFVQNLRTFEQDAVTFFKEYRAKTQPSSVSGGQAQQAYAVLGITPTDIAGKTKPEMVALVNQKYEERMRTAKPRDFSALKSAYGTLKTAIGF